MLAVMRKRPAAPRLPENLDRFGKARCRGRQRNLKGVEFVLNQTQARAKDKAPFGNRVDHGNLLGDVQRMIQRELEDARANLCVLGMRRQSCGKGEGRGHIAVRHLVMFRQEKQLKASLLGQGRLSKHLVIEPGQVLPVGRVLESENQSEFHAPPYV